MGSWSFKIFTPRGGPNSNYGLAQCYGDLSVQDCILCYASIRTYLPGCFPLTGGRIYLDGCYMRDQNYSFFEQYSGPNDTIVCGNTTRESRFFQDSTSQAVVNVVTSVLRNSGYFAKEEMIVSGTNKSVYVMAECWRTLSLDSCRACLVNASTSITKCLRWSEGRVLNTGCFMSYSNTNFLNPVPVISSSSNKGLCGQLSTISFCAEVQIWWLQNKQFSCIICLIDFGKYMMTSGDTV